MAAQFPQCGGSHWLSGTLTLTWSSFKFSSFPHAILILMHLITEIEKGSGGEGEMGLCAISMKWVCAHPHLHVRQKGPKKLKEGEFYKVNGGKYMHEFLDESPQTSNHNRPSYFHPLTHSFPDTHYKCEVAFTRRKTITYHLRDHIKNPLYEVNSKLTLHTQLKRLRFGWAWWSKLSVWCLELQKE